MPLTNLTQYYDATADHYDDLHNIDSNPEHTKALELGWPLLGQVSSVLDVGSGTGRSLQWIQDRNPGLKLFGIEPSEGLLALAETKLPEANLRKGIGEALPFDDSSIDVVIATGIMHHADDPSKVISEMVRVAQRGILISDHNNYAFGGNIACRIRMALRTCGLLSAFSYVKQGFKKQGYSVDDGWWYPYSLLDNYAQIAGSAKKVFIIPTRQPTGDLGNLVFAQSHLAIIAMK
jgi:ubiquinone/menaquinone biosynthesis C-methylase UbiE